MNSLDQDSLVLVLVTLGVQVELMVQSLVDLAGLAVLAQESSQRSLSADPKDLDGESSIPSTSSLTDASVSASSLGILVNSRSSARVDGDCLLDDETILNKLLDAAA